MIDRAERWEPITGKWDISGSNTYLGPQNLNNTFGLALCSKRLRDGKISVEITGDFDETIDMAARIIFGYNYSNGSYYSIGLGGYGVAHSLTLYEPERGWLPLKVVGHRSYLKKSESYNLLTTIHGQSVTYQVNGVDIFRSTIPTPIEGDKVGLFAWGGQKVEFKNINIESELPKAFIVMQFSETYESLYDEVIYPVVVENQRIVPCIARDISKPGIILEDIVQEIKESAFVIAEISPNNANVFYELGYAHALEKPVILLAEQNTKLPFDVSGYRCIFYKNSIKGKREVEDTLRKHIDSILD